MLRILLELVLTKERLASLLIIKSKVQAMKPKGIGQEHNLRLQFLATT